MVIRTENYMKQVRSDKILQTAMPIAKEKKRQDREMQRTAEFNNDSKSVPEQYNGISSSGTTGGQGAVFEKQTVKIPSPPYSNYSNTAYESKQMNSWQNINDIDKATRVQTWGNDVYMGEKQLAGSNINRQVAEDNTFSQTKVQKPKTSIRRDELTRRLNKIAGYENFVYSPGNREKIDKEKRYINEQLRLEDEKLGNIPRYAPAEKLALIPETSEWTVSQNTEGYKAPQARNSLRREELLWRLNQIAGYEYFIYSPGKKKEIEEEKNYINEQLRIEEEKLGIVKVKTQKEGDNESELTTNIAKRAQPYKELMRQNRGREEKHREQEENLQKKVNWWEILHGIVEQGFGAINKAITSVANMFFGDIAQTLQTGIGSTLQALGAEEAGAALIEKDNPITALNKWVGETNLREAEYYAKLAEGNKAAEAVNEYGVMVMAAVPALYIAIATKNFKVFTSLGTAGVEVFSSLAQSNGWKRVSAICMNALRSLCRDPNAQFAFIQAAGTSYENALAEGATEVEAFIYALTNGAWSAQIEVGGVDENLGGMQRLPANLQKATEKGDLYALFQYAKSVASEILEEEFQGMMERGLKLIYGVNTEVFSKDPKVNAIISPAEMKEEAKDAAIVSTVLGGIPTISRKIHRQYQGKTTLPNAENDSKLNINPSTNEVNGYEYSNQGLVDQELIAELIASGEKYTLDRLILITKSPMGNLMWLENGNTKSGLIHIIEKHGSDLTNRGINDIPQAIKEITTNVAPYYIGDNGIGVYADYIYNGKRYRIAYGYNGYIISFYPIK